MLKGFKKMTGLFFMLIIFFHSYTIALKDVDANRALIITQEENGQHVAKSVEPTVGCRPRQ